MIVKGKEEPVTLYELIQEKGDLPAEIIPCPHQEVIRMTEK